MLVGSSFPESESESPSVMSDSSWPHDLYSPWNSPGQNTGVCNLALPQGIFPTQRLNTNLPHYKWILYQLSHMGSPRILEWVAYPFSSRSSQPRNQTRVSFIAGGFFTNWALREALKEWSTLSDVRTQDLQIMRLTGLAAFCAKRADLFPDQRSDQGPQQRKCRVLTSVPPGSSLEFHF